MNLLLFEFKRKLMSLFWWGLGLSALQLFMLSFFPLMAQNQAMWDLILEYYPKEMLAAFGLANAASLGEIEGYLIFSFIFAQVALAIYASIEGFSVLSVEENDNIADFLLTKPISRSHIFMMKSLNALILFSLLSIITSLSTYLGILWFAPDATITPSIMLIFASLIPFLWLFYVSSLSISQLMSTLRSPVTYAMGLGFGMYMFYALGAAFESDVLRYFNFFNYMDIALILNNEPIEGVFILLTLVISVGAFVFSFIAYQKRNIMSK